MQRGSKNAAPMLQTGLFGLSAGNLALLTDANLAFGESQFLTEAEAAPHMKVALAWVGKCSVNAFSMH